MDPVLTTTTGLPERDKAAELALYRKRIPLQKQEIEKALKKVKLIDDTIDSLNQAKAKLAIEYENLCDGMTKIEAAINDLLK